MKKLCLVILLLIVPISVNAKVNKLYFTENGNRLYYESDLIDEKVFLNHTDMVPGESFKDILKIENGTNTNYKLYFKVEQEQQNTANEELLDNIHMIIWIDDQVIYEGNATGVNQDNNVNLHNAILLGNFPPGKLSEMIVETKLIEEYDNINNLELSMVDWTFYAQYEDEAIVEIIESPNTMKNIIPFTMIISIVVILLGLGTIGYAKKKKQ